MTTVERIHANRKRRQAEKLRHRRQSFAAAILLAVILCAVLVSVKDYDDFLERLAHRESTGDSAVVNRFGYMGLYQMGTMALQDAGFLNSDGSWTGLADSYGVHSKEDFLNSPQAQKAAVTAYHTKLCSYIQSYELDQYLGTEYQGVEVTKSGLLAACHLVGVRNMANALATGATVCDGNNVPASEYLEYFAGYHISGVWK